VPRIPGTPYMTKSTRFAQPFQDYEILDRLGSGGMGTVFRARQISTGRPVALKVLRPSLSRNPRYVDRLRREAEISMRLEHPHLVRGIGFGEEGGYHYLAMEFVEGKSLKELLATWGRFPEEQVVEMGRQIADALGYAHAQGVVHRDVKPGNILVDEEGMTHLTDLGLAKGFQDPSLTQVGATVGTPQYMSPEQARDPTLVDRRSDLYSLGATMFHMATGQPPFPGETVGQVIHRILQEGPPDLDREQPFLSGGFRLVLRKLLARDPGLRYQDADSLRADLERIAEGEEPSIDPKDLERGELRPGRRRWAWVGGTILAAVGFGLVASLAFGNDGSVEPSEIRELGRLRELLASAPSLRARFELLASFRPRGAEEALEAEALRAFEIQALDRQLDRFFAKEAGLPAFEAWLGSIPPPDWREAWFEGVLAGKLRKAFGFAPEDLPDAHEGGGPRTHYLRWRKRQEELCRRVVARLCRALLERERGRFRTELLPVVERARKEGRFRESLEVLSGMRKELLRILGSRSNPGLPPEGEAMFRELRKEIETRAARIRAEAASRVSAFESRIREDLASISSLLDRGFLRTAREALDRLEPAVSGKEPAWKSLPAGIEDPLPVLREEWTGRVRTWADRTAARESDLLNLLLDGIQDLLAERLDLAAAQRLLGSFSPTQASVRRIRDDWLDDLEKMDRALGFGRTVLCREGARRPVRIVLKHGPPLAGRLSPLDEGLGFVIRHATGEERSLELSELDPAAFLAEIRVLDPSGVQRHLEGFGLYLFFQDRFSEGLALLLRPGKEVARFLELQERRRSRKRKREEERITRILSWLEKAERLALDGGIEEARGILELLEANEPGLLLRASLQAAAGKVRSILRRHETLRSLRTSVPPAWSPFVTMRLDPEGGEDGVLMDLDFTGEEKRAGRFAGLSLGKDGLSLSSSSGEEVLVLEMLQIENHGTASMECEFLLPDGGWLDRLALSWGGVGSLLLQPPSGSGIAGPYRDRGGRDLDRQSARLLAEGGKSGSDGWYFLPGFRFRLRFLLGRIQEGRRSLEVDLNGRKIGSWVLPYDRRSLRTLRIRTDGEIRLRSLRLRGTAGR